jgi:hypothetical protein
MQFGKTVVLVGARRIFDGLSDIFNLRKRQENAINWKIGFVLCQPIIIQTYGHSHCQIYRKSHQIHGALLTIYYLMNPSLNDVQ